VAKHLILPEDAFDDFKVLLSLDREPLGSLVSIFATADTVTTARSELSDQVSERLGVEYESAKSIVFVTTFLLSVVGDGAPPSEVLRDIEVFVAKRGTPESQELLLRIANQRELFLSLLTPTAERLRAQKVQYLEKLRPQATSFRTVCELRPVFESRGDAEEITGLIPVVSLVVELTDSGQDPDRMILELSPAMLKELREVVARADKKVAALRGRFGTDLLCDHPESE